MDIRGVGLVCSVPGFGACPDRDLRMMARRILIVLCFVVLRLSSKSASSAWSRLSSAVGFFPPQEHVQAVSQTARLRARRLVRTNVVDELLKFGNERLWLPWLRHRPKTAGWIGATAEYNARACATYTNDDNYIYIIYTFYILYTLFIHYIYTIYILIHTLFIY